MAYKALKKKLLIILFKPFKVGDLVDAQGEIGTVKDIDIFTTQILTPTNKRVIIPNGTLANSNITNLSAEGKLRVDLTIGVGYDEDIKKTKDVLMSSVFAQKFDCLNSKYSYSCKLL